jgi:hypothetical protein
MSLSDLISKSKKGAAKLILITGLSSAAAIMSGCGYQRVGDQGISWTLIPTKVVVEKYADDTSNIVLEKTETEISTFFGNIDTTTKRWEKGKYLGKTIMKTRDIFNNPNTTLEEYDGNNVLIKDEKKVYELPKK